MRLPAAEISFFIKIYHLSNLCQHCCHKLMCLLIHSSFCSPLLYMQIIKLFFCAFNCFYSTSIFENPTHKSKRTGNPYKPIRLLSSVSLFHFLPCPVFHTLSRRIGQIFSAYYVCPFCSRFYSFHTARNPASPTRTKRYNFFALEIVGFQKCTDNHGLFIPPDGIIKCSLSLQSLVNTGFNAIHKCVLRSSFLFLFYC